MAKPNKIPTWATDGGAEITEPSVGKRAIGWILERPAYQYFNWLFNLIGTWLGFVDSQFASDGVKRVAEVDDLVALKALTPDDGDVARIATGASMVGALYVFALGNTVIADDVLIVADNGGTGRWLHVAAAVTYIANGLASLDGSGKVPDGQLGRGSANGVASLDASSKVEQEPASKGQASGVASLDASSKVIQEPASKGLANGVASLDASGYVPEAQLRRKWGVATANGSGAASATGSETFTVTPGALKMEVLFATPMPNANYVVTATPDGLSYFSKHVVIGTKTVNGFEIFPWDTGAQAVVDTTTNGFSFGFIVTG